MSLGFLVHDTESYDRHVCLLCHSTTTIEVCFFIELPFEHRQKKIEEERVQGLLTGPCTRTMTAEERGATGISRGTITDENMYFRQKACVLLLHLRIPQEEVR